MPRTAAALADDQRTVRMGDLLVLASDESYEIGRFDPDGVQDSDVRHAALVAQPVHGRRAHAETFSRLATVSRGGTARRSGNNRVTKSLGLGGRNVVPWDPPPALSGRFDEDRGPSGTVVDPPCADSEAEGHWFESSSARQPL